MANKSVSRYSVGANKQIYTHLHGTCTNQRKKKIVLLFVLLLIWICDFRLEHEIRGGCTTINNLCVWINKSFELVSHTHTLQNINQIQWASGL